MDSYGTLWVVLYEQNEVRLDNVNSNCFACDLVRHFEPLGNRICSKED